MAGRKCDDDEFGADEPDYAQMREDNFDEDAATERAERSYERAMFGD